MVGPFVVVASLPLVSAVCAVSGATETVVLKIVMHITNCCVRFFSTLSLLVNKNHLPGNCAALTPKIPHLRWVLKYMGPDCIGLLGMCTCSA